MSRRAKEEEIRAEMRARRPSGVVVSHFPPGQEPESFVPGDFSLHRATATKGREGATTTLGKLIQAGERARFGDSDFARWTHSTLIVSESGDIVEAIESGVAPGNIEKYRNSDYIVVHVSALPVQRELACGFAKSRVGDKYGIVNFRRSGVPGAVRLEALDQHRWPVHLLRPGRACDGEVHRRLPAQSGGHDARRPGLLLGRDLG
jgi:hypothetical protein